MVGLFLAWFPLKRAKASLCFQEKEKHLRTCVSYSRSNLMGTKFTVYDHGVSPIKAQGLVEKAHTRQELAAICYVSDRLWLCRGLGREDQVGLFLDQARKESVQEAKSSFYKLPLEK